MSNADLHPSPLHHPRAGLPLPLFLLQPILARIVRRIAAENPRMFNRLGPWVGRDYIIDPVDMPFVLHLRPDRDAPLMRAVSRRHLPDHVARISGRFLDLLELVDADLDGDALFFSRDLVIEGNTEAVVSLRNALDDIDGSIAERVADMHGAPGRATLAALRRMAERKKVNKE
ncbi:SCP2 domain-containing protein [Maritimibacter sp. HL-12]|jgi:O2-independent ubiquinone biosynthesis accessory factor UbiT|uniref:ubiquinone anaerobic biosynthesis accessory factor UbiT n=1 Tax=Maritimibacter sp. HL-12 TaxID=1162418 RepID=UPI000A0F1A06|nr:SCP2 sterol-binding domain-containing protein [Maritimibacter sp. HL-12]SMH52826.1 Predicted lipid carrier protein YhbT, contains SCP2 domain [Maritimibacter sp. HL-12]